MHNSLAGSFLPSTPLGSVSNRDNSEADPGSSNTGSNDQTANFRSKLYYQDFTMIPSLQNNLPNGL